MNLFFKALNDAARCEILELLKKGEMTAGVIVEHFNFSKPSVSHHLDLLRQAGLVDSTRDGQFVSYSLNTLVVDEMINWLMTFKKKKL